MVFPCKFCEIFESIFFAEHLRVTASTSSGFFPAQQTRFSARKGKLDTFIMRKWAFLPAKTIRMVTKCVFFLHFLVINQKKITFTLILTHLYTYLIAHSLYETLLSNLKILFHKINFEQKTISLVSLY